MKLHVAFSQHDVHNNKAINNTKLEKLYQLYHQWPETIPRMSNYLCRCDQLFYCFPLPRLELEGQWRGPNARHLGPGVRMGCKPRVVDALHSTGYPCSLYMYEFSASGMEFYAKTDLAIDSNAFRFNSYKIRPRPFVYDIRAVSWSDSLHAYKKLALWTFQNQISYLILSLFSKLSAYSSLVAYNFFERHPLDSYAENFFMSIQVFIVLTLIIILNSSSRKGTVIKLFAFFCICGLILGYIFVWHPTFSPNALACMQVELT